MGGFGSVTCGSLATLCDSFIMCDGFVQQIFCATDLLSYAHVRLRSFSWRGGHGMDVLVVVVRGLDQDVAYAKAQTHACGPKA